MVDPRRQKGGTYDPEWKENRWPRLPKDFDFGYWNCAPEDQQIAYPQGGEEILLAGLTPRQRLAKFTLPPPAVHAVARLQVGPVLPLPMNLDTIILDMKALTLICQRPADRAHGRQDVDELAQAVGRAAP